MSKTYIHYGSSTFHPELMMPITNRDMFVKPNGGLWASPIDTFRGWKDWCEANDCYLETLKESFTFELADDAKILHLYSTKQLDELPQITLPGEMQVIMSNYWSYLDFETLAEEYDGIELHLSEEIHDLSDGFMQGLYYKLYGWDCDSILIFHSHIIKLES